MDKMIIKSMITIAIFSILNKLTEPEITRLNLRNETIALHPGGGKYGTLSLVRILFRQHIFHIIEGRKY
jgi:hypothetical protein